MALLTKEKESNKFNEKTILEGKARGLVASKNPVGKSYQPAGRWLCTGRGVQWVRVRAKMGFGVWVAGSLTCYPPSSWVG